jgi:hypothetical protein
MTADSIKKMSLFQHTDSGFLHYAVPRAVRRKKILCTTVIRYMTFKLSQLVGFNY